MTGREPVAGVDVPDGRGRTGLDGVGRDLTGNPDVVVRDVEVTSDGWHVLRRTTYDRRRSDGTWTTESRETYDRGNGATVLLHDPDRDTVLLTRQFRFPAYVNGHPDGVLLEAAAGLLDEDDPETAVRRETREELGVTIAGPLVQAFDVFMSPGSVTERLHCYVGSYSPADRTHRGGGVAEEGEDIEVVELPLAEALAMVDDGRIRDAKTIMLLQWLPLRERGRGGLSQDVPVPAPTRLADALLDRAVVPGYSKLGPALRRRWWPADPAPGSMTGRRVLVTGATSGIGTAIAEGLLDLGATVHVLGRNRAKTVDLVARLGRENPGAEVVAEVCDVGDLDAVRAWAEDFTSRVDALHGLVHNAGALPEERSETAQGHELTLAVHVLGPHLMTALLTGTLADDAAVVWMSSGGMYGAGLRDDDLEFTDGEYSGVRAYARTKRMQVVLASEWARRLRGAHVYSTHPGWVATDGVTASIPGFGKLMAPLLRTPADGADTTVWLLATRPESRPPHFWHDRAQRPSTLGWERGQDPAKVRRFLDQVAAATDVAG